MVQFIYINDEMKHLGSVYEKEEINTNYNDMSGSDDMPNTDSISLQGRGEL